MGRLQLDIRLAELQQVLDDKRIKLKVDDAAKHWLADKGYDPLYGARALNRLITKTVGCASPLFRLSLNPSCRFEVPSLLRCYVGRYGQATKRGLSWSAIASSLQSSTQPKQQRRRRLSRRKKRTIERVASIDNIHRL